MIELPQDNSPAAVLLRHLARFMRAPEVGAGPAFDLAWDDARAQEASPTSFIVGGLFGAYLREMRHERRP